jgi:hypothetical protein
MHTAGLRVRTCVLLDGSRGGIWDQPGKAAKCRQTLNSWLPPIAPARADLPRVEFSPASAVATGRTASCRKTAWSGIMRRSVGKVILALAHKERRWAHRAALLGPAGSKAVPRRAIAALAYPAHVSGGQSGSQQAEGPGAGGEARRKQQALARALTWRRRPPLLSQRTPRWRRTPKTPGCGRRSRTVQTEGRVQVGVHKLGFGG